MDLKYEKEVTLKPLIPTIDLKLMLMGDIILPRYINRQYSRNLSDSYSRKLP